MRIQFILLVLENSVQLELEIGHSSASVHSPLLIAALDYYVLNSKSATRAGSIVGSGGAPEQCSTARYP